MGLIEDERKVLRLLLEDYLMSVKGVRYVRLLI